MACSPTRVRANQWPPNGSSREGVELGESSRGAVPTFLSTDTQRVQLLSEYLRLIRPCYLASEPALLPDQRDESASTETLGLGAIVCRR
jgi:hypothetical protein